VDGDEGGGAGVDGRHFLEHQRGIKAGQGEAAGILRGIQPAKPQLAGFGNGFFGEDGFGVPLRGVGGQLGHSEIARSLCKGALVFVQFKVHRRVSYLGAFVLIAACACWTGVVSRFRLNTPRPQGGRGGQGRGQRPRSYFKLIVVFTPCDAVLSSNQRAVTVLVCV
jgi:hypothetical protein